MDRRAADAGVDVRRSYVAPNEHAWFFALEADSFQAVSKFPGPPPPQDREADIVPVLTFGEVEAVLED